MFELRLLAPANLVEAASDALMDELGALSVSVGDADAGTQAERPLFGEPGMPVAASWQRSTLQALFEDEEAASTAAALLLAQEWAGDLSLERVQAVPDQDWVRLTQAQFSPVEITPDFWIVPTWHEVPPAARRFIRLDPGLAFGTGTHATTRMCLRWIARSAPDGQSWPRVLDYGCGSGILAICAALYGAIEVDGVDIDAVAVLATQANAEANAVTVRAGPPDAVKGCRYELVLANILSTPLKLLAPLLSSLVAPGGTLVLSGVLERQADEVVAAYLPWLELSVSDSLEGWVLITGTRALG